MTTNPLEIAELYVNGHIFTDWKSVLVELAADEVYSKFSFEATEFHEVPSSWTALQFKPGDTCDVKLGGVMVMQGGRIAERHVAYDANTHQIQLNGVSRTLDLTDTSIKHETGNLDGMTAQQAIQKILDPYGFKVKVVGSLSDEVFENLHIGKGENPYRKIWEIASHREIFVGSDVDAKTIVLTSNDSSAPVDALVEGGNILRANCVIRNPTLFSLYIGTMQRHNDDDINGDDADKIQTELPGKHPEYRPIILPALLDDSKEGLRMYTNFERMRRDGNLIEAHITVQGWFGSNGDIWRHNRHYSVRSPMLMLNAVMKSRKVVYTQSAHGTFTTLEMVQPEYVGGKLDIRT